MRKTRINAKVRVLLRPYFSGEIRPAEICVALDSFVYQNAQLFSSSDRNLVKLVCSETHMLPVGKLKEAWHPEFVGAKIAELQRYEAIIGEDVTHACERLLAKLQVIKGEQ